MTKQQAKLPSDSVVNVSQLFTIDGNQLRDYVSSLTGRRMAQVEAGLRKVLSL